MIANTFTSINKRVPAGDKTNSNTFTFILYNMETNRPLLLDIKSICQHWAMMEAQRYAREYEYTFVNYIGKNNEVRS